MKALVLSGGGARGAYEAGVASILARESEFDLICGTSIGALNAGFVASGRADALETFWCETLPKRVPILFPHIKRMRHMLNEAGGLGKGTRWNDARLITHMLGDMASDMRFLRSLFEPRKASRAGRIGELAKEIETLLEFDSMACKLIVAATNVSLGTPVAFHARCEVASLQTPIHRLERTEAVEWRRMNAQNFAWALLASAALPGLLAPIDFEFDGIACSYADGGLVHNSPIGLAIDAGATEITVVFVDPVFNVTHSCPERGIGRMACAVFVLWQQRALEYELRLVDATNALVRAGHVSGRREIQIRYVRPERTLGLDLLGFDDTAAIAQAFNLGKEDAKHAQIVV